MGIFKKKSKWEKFYDKNEEFIRYTTVSIVCTIILYTIYILVNFLTNDKYLLANFLGYSISFTILYIWDMKIFKSKPRKKEKRISQLINFIIFRVIGFIIDSLILLFFVESLKIDSLISKVISSCITFMFNYLTNKWFVFSNVDL